MIAPSATPRDRFRILLVELLALKVAIKLDTLELPPQDLLEKYRNLAAPEAEAILNEYEKSLLVEAVTNEVIERLRSKLVARVRSAKVVEIGNIIGTVLVAGLMTLSAFIFDPVKNHREIVAIYYFLIFLVSLQFIGNLYLAYFDRSR